MRGLFKVVSSVPRLLKEAMIQGSVYLFIHTHIQICARRADGIMTGASSLRMTRGAYLMPTCRIPSMLCIYICDGICKVYEKHVDDGVCFIDTTVVLMRKVLCAPKVFNSPHKYIRKEIIVGGKRGVCIQKMKKGCIGLTAYCRYMYIYICIHADRRSLNLK